MGETVGKYLQRKKKAKGIPDKAIAEILSLSVSAVEKMYLTDDIQVSRIVKLSALLEEDLVEDYYYRQEPLKSMRQKEIDEWQKKIDGLKSIIASQKANIAQLNEHIHTQAGYISLLEKEVQRLDGNPKKRVKGGNKK